MSSDYFALFWKLNCTATTTRRLATAYAEEANLQSGSPRGQHAMLLDASGQWIVVKRHG
jgi:hypothetical protein